MTCGYALLVGSRHTAALKGIGIILIQSQGNVTMHS